MTDGPNRATPAPTPQGALRGRRIELLATGGLAALVAMLSLAPQGQAQSFLGTAKPGGPVTVSSPSSGETLVDVMASGCSTTAVINWQPTDTTGTGTVNFQPAGTTATFHSTQNFTVLNVVDGVSGRPIGLNGTINTQIGSNPVGGSGGTVWFYSPGGFVVGSSAIFNVGSLLLSANKPSDYTTDDGTVTGTPNNPNFNTHTPQFVANSGSTAAIEIQAGAQINASNYIAMVAPQVIQNGTVRAGGEVAYVAGEDATLTMPSSGGLFGIEINTGTSVAQAITHGGSTISTGTPPNQSRNIYFVAVPKNVAVTMLLGGQIGYSAAADATVDGENIILTDGFAEYGGSGLSSPATGPGTTISIDNATFYSNVTAFGQNIVLNASTGDTLFKGNADFFAANSITSTIGAGRTLSAAGDLSLSAGGIGTGGLPTAGTIAINVNGGTLSVGRGLHAYADGSGDSMVSASIETPAPGNDFTGGSVSLTVNDGSVVAQGEGGIELHADGTGSDGADGGMGGKGTGGTVSLTLNGGSLSTPGELWLSADGQGGGSNNASGPGGGGVGGSVTLALQPSLASGPAPSVTVGDIYATAQGIGYTSGCDCQTGTGVSGGFGTGGNLSFTMSAGTLTTSDITLLATGEGGTGDYSFSDLDPASGNLIGGGHGGSGTGGQVTASITGGHLSSLSLTADTSGNGGNGGDAYTNSSSDSGRAGDAGGAMGGTTQVTISDATVEAPGSPGQGISISAIAGATGGQAGNSDNEGGGNGGVANGGSASIAIGGGPSTSVLASSLFIDGSAIGGGGGRGSTSDDEQPGNAIAGTADLTITGGTVQAGSAQLDSSAQGGVGGSSSFFGGTPAGTGTAFGGASTVDVQSGSFTVDEFDLTTAANLEPASGVLFSSLAKGGDASVLVSNGGAIQTSARLQIRTVANTSSTTNGDAGSATAGSITVNASGGGQIVASLDAEADAQSGGSGNGNPGFAQAGAINLTADGGALNLGGLFLSGSATSGNGPRGSHPATASVVTLTTRNGGTLVNTGGDNSIDTNTVVPTINATAMSATGTAVSGNITFNNEGGQISLLGRTTDIDVSSSEGAGGSISIQANGGTTEFGDTTFTASGLSTPGAVSISNGAPLSFAKLTISEADGRTTGVDISSTTNSRITVAGDAAISASDHFAYQSILNSGIDVGGTLSITSPNLQILGSHATGIRTLSAQTIELAGDTLNVDANIGAADSLSLTGGAVSAGGLTAGNVITVSGTNFVQVVNATVTAPAASNDGGGVSTATSRIAISAGNGDSTGNIDIFGTVQAPGSVSLSSTGYTHIEGSVLSDNRIDVNASEVSLNIQGSSQLLAAQNPLNATSGGLDVNSASTILNVGTMGARNGAPVTLEASGIDTRGGTLVAGDLTTTLTSLASNPSDPSQQTILLGDVDATGAVNLNGGSIDPLTISFGGNLSAASLTALAQNQISIAPLTGTPTLSTTGAISLTAQTGAINGSSAASLNAGTDLALNAATDIDAAALSLSATNIVLNAPNTIRLADAVATGLLGSDPMGSPINVSGLFSITGTMQAGQGSLSISAPGGITLGRVKIATGGTLDLNAGSGAVSLADASASEVGSASNAAVSGGAITIGSLASAGSISLIGTGAVQVTNDLAAGGAVTAIGTSVSLNSLGALSFETLSSSTGDIAVNTAGALAVPSASSAGALTLTSGADLVAGDLSAQTALILNAAGALNVSRATASTGDIDLTSGGDLTLTSGDAAGALQITSTGGSAALGLFTIGTDLLVHSAADLTFGDLTLPGAIDLASSAGTVTTGALTAGGNITLAGATGLGFTTLSGGTLALSSGSGAITGNRITATNGATLTAGGAITIDTDVAVTGALDASGRSLALTATGPLDVTNGIATGGGITLTSGGSLALDTGSATGDIALASGGDLAIGTVSATGGALTATSSGGSITAGSASSSGALTLAAAQGISFDTLDGASVDLAATNGALSGATLSATGTARLRAGGTVSVTNSITAGGGADVAGTSITLTAPGPLTLTSAVASAGDVTITTGGDLVLASGSAAGAIRLTSNGGSLSADSIDANGDLIFQSANDLSIGDASFSGAVELASSAGSITTGALSAGGTLSLSGATGLTFTSVSGRSLILSGGSGALTGGSISTSGDATLTAGGALRITQDIAVGGALSVTGGSVALTALNGLAVASATATTGDLVLTARSGGITGSHLAAAGQAVLTAPGAILSGDISAGGISATGASIDLTAAGALIGTQLATTGTARLRAGGAVNVADISATGGVDVAGASVALTSSGPLTLTSAVASAGDLAATSAGDLTLTSGSATGAIRLASTSGAVNVYDANATGSIADAPLRSAAFNPSAVGTASTPGAVTIASATTATLDGTVSATGAIGVTAADIAVTGSVVGPSISFVSRGITIGNAARIGQAGVTTAVTFTNNGSQRSFIGGTSGSGYLLTAAGLGRVQADAITLNLPAVAGGSAADPDVTIGDLTLHGSTGTAQGTLANLTSSGIFTINTPGRVRVSGKLLLTDLGAGNGLTISAGPEIDVISPTGAILLTDSSGAPIGSLDLRAQRIVVASQSALTDLSALNDTPARSSRLAINDGPVTDQGYVAADHVTFRIADALDVQNSGGTAPADRRGVTSGRGGVDVILTGTGTPEVILNGHPVGGTSNDFPSQVRIASLNGSARPELALGSTVNGCFVATNCGSSPVPTTTLVSLIVQSQSAVAAVTDSGSNNDQDEKKAADDSKSPPSRAPGAPLVSLPRSRTYSYGIVIDEPVTGTGNDDLDTNQSIGIGAGPVGQ